MKNSKTITTVGKPNAVAFWGTVLVAATISGPAQAAPIARYHLNGDASDNVGSRHGAIIGTTTFVPGVSGQAIDFRGPGGYVALPGTFVDYAGANAFSIALWFQLGASGGDWDYLFHSFDDQPGMRLNEFDQLLFLFKGSIGDSPLSGSQPGGLVSDPIPLDTWTHAVMTWDGSEFLGYVNGAEVVSISLPFFNFGGAPKLGWDNDPGRVLQGLIDEVSLYDYALSGHEVLDLSREFAPVPEGNLVPGLLVGVVAGGVWVKRRRAR